MGVLGGMCTPSLVKEELMFERITRSKLVILARGKGKGNSERSSGPVFQRTSCTKKVRMGKLAREEKVMEKLVFDKPVSKACDMLRDMIMAQQTIQRADLCQIIRLVKELEVETLEAIHRRDIALRSYECNLKQLTHWESRLRDRHATSQLQQAALTVRVLDAKYANNVQGLFEF